MLRDLPQVAHDVEAGADLSGLLLLAQTAGR
jgi:hypothetical protein